MPVFLGGRGRAGLWTGGGEAPDAAAFTFHNASVGGREGGGAPSPPGDSYAYFSRSCLAAATMFLSFAFAKSRGSNLSPQSGLT